MSSPLGLVSQPNFKKSKATTQYNRITKKNEPENNKNYDQSMFGSDSVAYFPSKSNENDGQLQKEISDVNKTPHTNDIYDVRTQAIIDWSTTQSAALKFKAADFAYLRLLGVYPNNRLIVCRKFGAPIGNDLSVAGVAPVSTILTWRLPGEDFFDISFGEEWKEAETSFKKVLNDIGEQFRLNGVGDSAAGGFGITPLPGFTEIWQRQIMKEIGLIDSTGAGIIPSGSPNLIKEAKVRTTIADDETGSGLSCEISVKVIAEYEQKFIGGLDPTKAFYDIIGNITKFGTQNSVFYLNGGGDASEKTKKFLNDLKTDTRTAIKNLVEGAINALIAVKDTILDALGLGKKPDDDEEKEEPDGSTVFDKFINALLSVVSGIVKKFEVRILGIINALTGEPSGNYHVTIGNPKRPLFCSGDMIVKSVNLKFGETLAFNDLPSRVTAEFTMTNARPIGLQEITARFAQGVGRSYKPGPSSWQEASGGDFTPSALNNTDTTTATDATTTTTTTIEPKTPVGGQEDNGSSSDGSENNEEAPSNQTFSVGSGQESNTNTKIDADKVKNPTELSTPATPPVNDVKPPLVDGPQQQGNVPTTAGLPDSGKVGQSNRLTPAQVSESSNEDLKYRNNKIDEELKNTPETITNKGTNADGSSYDYSTINPRHTSLTNEKDSIDNELQDREDQGLV